MAQRRRNVASKAGSRPALHSVDFHRPLHEASVWGRRRVLLLNSTYEPLTALPIRRAVVMLLCGKADVVHDDPNGPVIHSATRTIAVPSVIRLRSYVRVPYRARIPMTRAALMHRDRFRCAYCGGQGRHRRPCGAAQPRRRPLLGELRRRVLGVQPPQGRQAADRTGLDVCGWCRPRPKGQHWRLLCTVKELDPAWVRYLGEGAA